MSGLTAAQASAFTGSTLGHLGREYPSKLDHVLCGPEDVLPPSLLHPLFYGSFDWHSCVHGWWQVMRLLRLFPAMPEARAVRDRADEMLVPAKVQGEIAYLDRPFAAGFERPYGWAWVLALHDELCRHEQQSWAEAIEPLARIFASRLVRYLTTLSYPIRHGIHSNSAFAMTLGHRWAKRRDRILARVIVDRAADWFGQDRASQAWEPSGDEFLSPTLTEAMVMSETMRPAAFQAWFDEFLPQLAAGEPRTLFAPAFVSDRTDGKIGHLDGLNLSRAWCWRQIAAAVAPGHAARLLGREAADRHLSAALPHLTDNYMGEHWLATFALLALEDSDHGD